MTGYLDFETFLKKNHPDHSKQSFEIWRNNLSQKEIINWGNVYTTDALVNFMQYQQGQAKLYIGEEI